MKTLVDTAIWSEITRARNAVVSARASAYLAQYGRLTLSVVTVFETIRGLSQRRRDAKLDEFREVLDAIEVLDLDRTAADLAGRVYGELERTGQKIDIGDAL